MTPEVLSAFFGWMTVLNFGVLILSTVMILALQDRIAAFHGRIFQMEPAEVRKAYFKYLANYKVLTIVFCMMPWIALKLT